jgi:dTDP-4-amino-4,6-dideoxygalactose transaminase
VFVDIDDTYQMNPDALSAAISPRTKGGINYAFVRNAFRYEIAFADM